MLPDIPVMKEIEERPVQYLRCVGGCGGYTIHHQTLPSGKVIALCASCVLDGMVQKLSGEIAKEIAPKEAA